MHSWPPAPRRCRGCIGEARTWKEAVVYWCTRSSRFLVIANGIAACYSLLQGARCLMMAYFTISAVAVAMEAALIGKYGTQQFQWMKTCHLYKRFCAQAGGGLACAIAASVNMVAIALVSTFNLFRLYGSGKGGRK
ncbi:hypothetical protein PR202_gb18892 [Eleusine coracana subsp. coracana]|uniref:CASP-like protein n=1 Tax=Eleusine coracana subsp. coracana TaxID=191504 RepID=A0AAV5F7D1_ELECO|nr:hypothetical protein PR202_gb18892 [Eleusine coracana subsp. coracana]